MSIRRTLFSLVLALAVAVGTTSCGGGGHHVGSGAIEVENSFFSFFFIEAIEVVESYGPGGLFIADAFVFPGEAFLVDGLFPTDYDVLIHWSDGFTDIYPGVPVYEFSVTPLFVEN